MYIEEPNSTLYGSYNMVHMIWPITINDFDMALHISLRSYADQRNLIRLNEFEQKSETESIYLKLKR